MVDEAAQSPVMKVTALVIRQGTGGPELLVFDHPAGAGGTTVQVPAGTVEDGEAPEQAVVRELNEETGVEGKIDRLVDVRNEVYGSEQRSRTVFLMSPVGEVSDVWPYLCDCGTPVRCRWESVDTVQLHPFQAPWLERARSFIRDGKCV